jgi:perosamine synthetase
VPGVVIPTHRPALGPEELSAVGRVFDSRWLGLGDVTRAFEEALQTWLDVPHVVGVSSGTAALHLALEALALPVGSGVVVPSLTFAATVQAILAAGLRPVFCEVDDTLQIDLHDVQARLSSRGPTPTAERPRVLMPVHFGGASCDMRALAAVAEQHGLHIVEDAAHAFGSTHGGRALGTFGSAGCFSFDPIKNVTCGEGGAVATHSADIAARVTRARALGISSDGWRRHTGAASWAYDVSGKGWRYHLPNMNAAIGLAQLDRASAFRARKQAIVRQYDRAFASLAGIERVGRPDDGVFPFTYAVRVGGGRRDALMAHLGARGVGTAVEYIPNHLQPAFSAYRTELPITERLYGEILSLPLFAELTDADVSRVVESVVAFFEPGGQS